MHVRNSPPLSQYLAWPSLITVLEMSFCGFPSWYDNYSTSLKKKNFFWIAKLPLPSEMTVWGLVSCQILIKGPKWLPYQASGQMSLDGGQGLWVFRSNVARGQTKSLQSRCSAVNSHDTVISSLSEKGLDTRKCLLCEHIHAKNLANRERLNLSELSALMGTFYS